MDLDNLTQISKRDLEMIELHQFQQPIYCSNVTAIAYAFTALGYLTTVDEIFYVAQLPIASVLDDGMTLAETYDTCLLYIKRKQLPLSVRVEHFDKPSMTLEAFIREVEAAVRDENDVHILTERCLVLVLRLLLWLRYATFQSLFTVYIIDLFLLLVYKHLRMSKNATEMAIEIIHLISF